MQKLSESEISDQLSKNPEWAEVNGEITRTFLFDDFVASIAFVNSVAGYAETAQHHPDILIRYNKVTLTVSTHDAGGITQKDFDLASEVESFAAKS